MNHYDEAERLIASLGEIAKMAGQFASPTVVESINETVRNTIALAQVHATLATVEDRV